MDDERCRTYRIFIDSNKSLSKILDEIYFEIEGHVEAYTYLTDWTLINMATDEKLIIKYAQERIPANLIFKSNDRWKVVFLNPVW